MTVLEALRGYGRSRAVRLTVLASPEEIREYSAMFPEYSWIRITPPSVTASALSVLRRVIGEGPPRRAWRKLRVRLAQSIKQLHPGQFAVSSPWFRRHGFDLLLVTHAYWPTCDAGVPYVFTIHDLEHRLQPQFTENTEDGWGDWIEGLHRNGVRHAELVVAESAVGRSDIIEAYAEDGVTADRVRILPYCAPRQVIAPPTPEEVATVRRIYNLPERYLFYPAAFWSHKNHLRIIEALGMLKQREGLEIPIVLCGSQIDAHTRRTFAQVTELASRLGITHLVRYLGQVPENVMSGLYGGAVALVMPTFFGPTNLPILEAWAAGCPALTSRIRGVEEQAGSAAILVNPNSADEIADGIRRLWVDPLLRSRLAASGRDHLAAYSADAFRERIFDILDEAIACLQGNP